MGEEFDPSDQFFQAYRAGFVAGYDEPELPTDVGSFDDLTSVWDRYLAWLNEDGVTT